MKFALLTIAIARALADSYTLDTAWPAPNAIPSDSFEVTAVTLINTPEGGRHVFAAQRNASIPFFMEFDIATGARMSSFNSTGILSPHGLKAAFLGNNLWVADIDGCKLVEMTQNGTVVSSFGTCGSGLAPLQFSQVADIAFANSARSDIIVADGDGGMNSRVARVNRLDHSVVWAVGGNGTLREEFQSPHSVATDGQQRVWVADRLNLRLVVLGERDGAWLGEWNSTACFPGANPWGVRIDEVHGRVVMVDGAVGQILVFNLPTAGGLATCALVHTITLANGPALKPHLIEVDRNGNIYVALAGTPPGLQRYIWNAV